MDWHEQDQQTGLGMGMLDWAWSIKNSLTPASPEIPWQFIYIYINNEIARRPGDLGETRPAQKAWPCAAKRDLAAESPLARPGCLDSPLRALAASISLPCALLGPLAESIWLLCGLLGALVARFGCSKSVALCSETSISLHRGSVWSMSPWLLRFGCSARSWAPWLPRFECPARSWAPWLPRFGCPMHSWSPWLA